MTNPKDNIRVGNVVMVYSEQYQAWIAPGGRKIRNPLTAQRVAEQIHNLRSGK
ncbi:DUF1317 family protein [Kosakonia cowanii]